MASICFSDPRDLYPVCARGYECAHVHAWPSAWTRGEEAGHRSRCPRPSLARLRVTRLGDAGGGPCPEPVSTGPGRGWGTGAGHLLDSYKWRQVQTFGFIFEGRQGPSSRVTEKQPLVIDYKCGSRRRPACPVSQANVSVMLSSSGWWQRNCDS